MSQHESSSDQISTEIQIEYNYTPQDEPGQVTVRATAINHGDRVTIETADGNVAMVARDTDESIRLHSVSDGEKHLAFYGPDDNSTTIQIRWKYDGHNVHSITLSNTVYNWVTDMLATARSDQSMLDAAEAVDQTGVEIPTTPLAVTETRVGRKIGKKRVVEPAENTSTTADAWPVWRDAIQRAGDYHTTHHKNYMYPPEGEGYSPGDTLTLHDLIDEWHCIDAADVIREHRLAQVSPADFQPGDILRVERKGGRGDNLERGVVMPMSGIDEERIKPQAKVYWPSGNHSFLTLFDGLPRIGRCNSYDHLDRIDTVDPAQVNNQDLLDLRQKALESAEVKHAAANLSVEADTTWETSGAVEGDRATDLHGRVTVSGGVLDESITVHCRNLFDAGWTASIESDANLDSETEEIVIEAARENSPIPTFPRL